MALFSKRKHGPLPWKIGKAPNGQTAILDANNGLVACMEAGNEERRKADAAYIVEVANKPQDEPN